MNRHPTTRKLNVKTNKKDDIIEFKHNISYSLLALTQIRVLSALIHSPQQIHHIGLNVIRDWVVSSVPCVVTLNIKTKSCKYKKLNHDQMLLVFVNLLNNNNFSVKYIHLKSPFFGK